MTINANSTSYFSVPSPTLDPKLFQGRTLKHDVRADIVSTLNSFLEKKYHHPEIWAHAWLAGSAVSYQWQAARQPGDLDCLVGVDFLQFRKANPSYQGLSDTEISAELNEGFKTELDLKTSNWNGYELTFYVNPTATDIKTIRPYAAYDLKYDEWTVTPDPQAQPPYNQEWEKVVKEDSSKADQIHSRVTAAVNELQMSTNPAIKRNAELKAISAGQQGLALFSEIHSNRSQAFSPSGKGYADFNNYRWQAGKREGTIQKLKGISKYLNGLSKTSYGVELPDTATLIRRAAVYRAE